MTPGNGLLGPGQKECDAEGKEYSKKNNRGGKERLFSFSRSDRSIRAGLQKKNRAEGKQKLTDN